MTEGPTHILAEAGDRHVLCGAKDALPRVLERFVQVHVEGHGMIVCPECEAVRDG